MTNYLDDVPTVVPVSTTSCEMTRIGDHACESDDMSLAALSGAREVRIGWPRVCGSLARSSPGQMAGARRAWTDALRGVAAGWSPLTRPMAVRAAAAGPRHRAMRSSAAAAS